VCGPDDCDGRPGGHAEEEDGVDVLDNGRPGRQIAEFSAFLESKQGAHVTIDTVAVLHGPSIFNRQFEPMEAAGEVSQNVSHMPHFR
jgi:hypothetical protein